MDFFLGWAKNHMKIFVVVSNRFFFFNLKPLPGEKKSRAYLSNWVEATT